jgi:hypothetical protein
MAWEGELANSSAKRRDRDSNPGWVTPCRFSRPVQSATLPSLQMLASYCKELQSRKGGLKPICCLPFRQYPEFSLCLDWPIDVTPCGD